MPSILRALVLPVQGHLPPPLVSLLSDYRLLVNETLREALSTGKTARGSLSRFARNRAFVHQLTGQHAVVAAEIALSLAKSHRRRLRNGSPSSVPFVRRPFLRTNPHTFHLDRASGKVRLSLRNGEWTSFFLHLAPYHRHRLSFPGVEVKQLHLTPDRAILYLERPAPPPYEPRALVAFDTNESSLDGVQISKRATHPVRIAFPQIRALQEIHAARRRRLRSKKATDRRVGKRLLRREGVREHHRITSRLHALTHALISAVARHHAAIALEDFSKLSRPRPRGTARWRRGSAVPRGPGLRRRLSAWPRYEMHRQLEYKAAEHGVPIYWVNPFRTSTICPRCGVYAGPRSRVGPTFVCVNPSCGWRLDRQLNAGANVGRIVLRDHGRAELGGLRLALDAVSHEAMRPRYPFERIERARAEWKEREGPIRAAGVTRGLGQNPKAVAGTMNGVPGQRFSRRASRATDA